MVQTSMVSSIAWVKYKDGEWDYIFRLDSADEGNVDYVTLTVGISGPIKSSTYDTTSVEIFDNIIKEMGPVNINSLSEDMRNAVRRIEFDHFLIKDIKAVVSDIRKSEDS